MQELNQRSTPSGTLPKKGAGSLPIIAPDLIFNNDSWAYNTSQQGYKLLEFVRYRHKDR